DEPRQGALAVIGHENVQTFSDKCRTIVIQVTYVASAEWENSSHEITPHRLVLDCRRFSPRRSAVADPHGYSGSKKAACQIRLIAN
ncbi:MAG: hypothetical protein U0989_20555, partial [Azonexus sp.]|nr:hypothetical protein [Azonexus sp.]